MPGYVDILSIGGTGGFGMNATLVQGPSGALLIDFGIAFPRGADLGAARVYPDVSGLLERVPRLDAIFITHAHDDHVAGLPYLPPAWLESPVYGTPLTLDFARERCREHRGVRVDLRPVTGEDWTEAGAFRVRMIPVTHSIPEARALIVESPVGRLVHSGDFRLDPRPWRGPITDTDALRRAGEAGVRLLMVDSTGVRRPGRSGSESDVAPHLADVVARCRGQIVATTFSSHLHRIDELCAAARSANRHVAFLGQRMATTARIGLDRGQLDLEAGLALSATGLGKLPRERRMYIAGGCQGEPASSMGRISAGQHPDVDLTEGDVALFSSSVVPGCEVAVSAMIDRLLRAGVSVFHPDDDPRLHASGHGSREEIAEFIDLVRPELLLPVHGDRAHLERVAELAREFGDGSMETAIIEQGECIRLHELGFERLPAVEIPWVFAGDGGLVIDSEAARDRRRLSQAGCVAVVVDIDGRREDGGLPRIRIDAAGIPGWGDARGPRETTERVVATLVDDLAPRIDALELEEIIGARVASTLRRGARYRPRVFVSVLASQEDV